MGHGGAVRLQGKRGGWAPRNVTSRGGLAPAAARPRVVLWCPVKEKELREIEDAAQARIPQAELLDEDPR